MDFMAGEGARKRFGVYRLLGGWEESLQFPEEMLHSFANFYPLRAVDRTARPFVTPATILTGTQSHILTSLNSKPFQPISSLFQKFRMRRKAWVQNVQGPLSDGPEISSDLVHPRRFRRKPFASSI
jgi:hypothetical protein